MGYVPLPPQLRSVLQVGQAGELSEAHLEMLLDLREDDFLEVKRELPPPKKNRELAADIAAFANGSGGLLLFGVEEEDDVLSALNPLDAAGAELKIRQVVAGNIFPPLNVAVDVIPSATQETLAFVAVTVPPSSLAPHAVTTERSELRYVVRDGPGKRNMGESEVASRYAGRFVTGQQRLDLLQGATESLRSRLVQRPGSVRLIVGIAPQVAGSQRISQNFFDETPRWLTGVADELPLGNEFHRWRFSVAAGFRRIILSHEGGVDAELYGDGIGVLVASLQPPSRSELRVASVPDVMGAIKDDELSVFLMAALMLLGRHVVRCGAGGDLDVWVSLWAQEPVTLYGWATDGMSGSGYRRLTDEPVTVAERIINVASLGDVADPGPKLVAASHILVSDLTSGFGVPDAKQTDTDGRLHPRHFGMTTVVACCSGPNLTTWKSCGNLRTDISQFREFR